MNSIKDVESENLKRKNNTMYPEIFGVGVDKRKGVDANREKDKSKPKFVFTTITCSDNKKANGNTNCDKSTKYSNDTKISTINPNNSLSNVPLKPPNNSVSHFNLLTSTGTGLTNSLKTNNPNLNLRNTNQLILANNTSSNNEMLNQSNIRNKLSSQRSFSVNKLKIPSGLTNMNKNNIYKMDPLIDTTNRVVPIKTRAISEDPESKEISRNKIANHPLITEKEMLTDYWQCGGDLNNLRERIKNKKKSQNADNENEIKINIDQIKTHIQNANNYINNVYKNYREKFRNSNDTSVSDCSAADITFKLKISDDEINSSNNEYGSSIKQLNNTEPKPKNFDDSSSKRRLSHPTNFQYSAEYNPFYSTQTSESNNNNEVNESIKKKEDNNMMRVDKVNKFSFDNDEEKLESYYKNNINKSEEVIELDKDQVKAIEIINTKIIEKEKDLDFMVENFDLLIEYDKVKKEQHEKMIREYTENQFLLMKRLAHLEAALRNKTNENNSLSISLQELMNELDRGESHRRKLHNYIQELRGNIRVFCRVKPSSNEFSSADDQTQISSIVRYPELTTANTNNSLKPNTNEVNHLFSIEILNKETISANNSSSTFHFDRVFTENTSQKEIFQEIKPFIQSALDGDNICIFAYGATGSGKTYTMQGPSWALDNKELAINEFSGILPRSASYIFDELTRLNLINYSCKISISAIEIYNENIYDLFDNNSNKQQLQIFFAKNVVQLKNLIWHQLNSKEDIMKFTKEASETRRSDNTKYNENSSRSHAIYQLKLEFVRNQKQMESYINIIDLAGSERCSLTSFNNKSKEEIESMKKLQNETNFINKSLTTLGRIISMLADKKMSKLAVPYRESKLTMILQNSLKSTSKTAMIVTICSDFSSLQQSKETLKFATNAMMAC